MKRMLIEIDDRSARDLERVAPTRERRRAEFVRLAIRRALDLAMEGTTRKAYAVHPSSERLVPGDLEGWDPHNRLARHRKDRAKRAA